MNRVTITGRLTKDPELRHPDGREGPVCDLRVAFDQSNGKTGYIDVATFDNQAKACERYLAKGRRVGIDGRLVFSEWTGQDGQKRQRLSVIGQVEFLDSRPQGEEQAPEPGEQPAEREYDTQVA